MKNYSGPVPPCGVYCGGCPRYQTGKKNSCNGVQDGCIRKKCKSFYACCIEKRGLSYCFQCSVFPCARFRQFARNWLELGQDLIANQEFLQKHGVRQFRKKFQDSRE